MPAAANDNPNYHLTYLLMMRHWATIAIEQEQSNLA